MNKITIIAFGILIIAGVWYFLLQGKNQEQSQTSLRVPAPGNENVKETVVNSDGMTERDTDGEKPPLVREIDSVSDNFFYDPEDIEIEMGETLVINFQNSGVHTFTIDELGIDEPLRGDSAIVEFTPRKSGTFEYYCAIPGHKEKGMIGNIIVN